MPTGKAVSGFKNARQALSNTPALPPEIWEIISCFACTDDGFTGQSLALVSKSVCFGTSRYRLQSASICGLVEVEHFLRILELRSTEFCLVRFLYISGLSRSQMKAMKGNEPPSDLARWYRMYRTTIATVASNIEVLTVGAYAHRLPSGLHLPVLRDLSIPSFIYYLGRQGEHYPNTPSLRRLHLWGNLVCTPTVFALSLLQRAPQLNCLRLSGLTQEAQIPVMLGRLLGIYTDHDLERITDTRPHRYMLSNLVGEKNPIRTLMHPNLRFVLVEPCAEGKGSMRMMIPGNAIHILRDLAAVSRYRSRRVILLPTTRPNHIYNSRQAYADWINVVGQGSQGINNGVGLAQFEGPWRNLPNT